MKYISVARGDSTRFDNEARANDMFVNFYMNGCPHCDAMKGEWRRLRKVKGRRGTIIDVEANEIPHIKSECAKGINGFPTIMKVNKGGKTCALYQGGRDYGSFVRFINANFPKELVLRKRSRTGKRKRTQIKRKQSKRTQIKRKQSKRTQIKRKQSKRTQIKRKRSRRKQSRRCKCKCKKSRIK